MEIRERRLGPDDPLVVASLIALGSALGRDARHADAVREYRRAAVELTPWPVSGIDGLPASAPG